MVTPYYNKATQKGLIEHYTRIANAIKVPVIMYNVPSRTGCNLAPETIAHLVKNVDNIVGVKDATGNLSHAAQTMSLCDGKIEMYSGNDDQVLPLLSLGGLGVISVLSNIAPRQTHDLVMEYLEGDREKARKIQLDAIPLINALFCEVNPIPVKAAMNMPVSYTHLSWEFFDYLLETANVVGTPGSGFGPSGEGYFRLTAFGSYENTLAALERIKAL